MFRKPTTNNFVLDTNAIATAKLNQQIAIANIQKNNLLGIISQYLKQKATREETQTSLGELATSVSGLS
jgi:hypothetical protein